MATINLQSFPEPEQFDCPKCGNAITLYDPEGSEYCVCSSCYSLIRFNAHNNAIIQKQAPTVTQEPAIKTGTRCTLLGTTFIVTGYAVKKEKNADFTWREYLLYNYEKGYANLAEYDGHWTFVAGAAFYPDLDKLKSNNWHVIYFQDQEYRLFNSYTAVTIGLTGESDWNLLDEKMLVSEFVAAPLIIYKEKASKGEDAVFYLGSYIEPDEIASAFDMDISQLPQRTGTGANQPSKWMPISSGISKIIFLLLALTAVCAFIIALIHPAKRLLDGNYYMTADSTKVYEYKSFATPSFRIGAPSAAVDFLIYADLNNSWMEATIVLVNEQNNQTWEVTESIEYYYGSEGGESWSEGSHEAEVVLSSIPPGTYHLNIYPASGGGLFGDSIHITVTERTILWRNMLVTMLILVLYPAYSWYRARNFEKRRWMNSDFSPYKTEEE